MKRLPVIIFSVLLSLSFLDASAQIWSPQLTYYSGYSTIFGPLNYYGVPMSIYQGNVIAGVANGPGTWYFSNGDIFVGTFYQGWAHGPGVFFRYGGGYLEGCWYGGQYAGSCYSEIRQFYDQHSYGGADDALAGTTQNVPESYSVDTENYNTNSSSSTGGSIHSYGGF
jgi:hypothetical protein